MHHGYNIFLFLEILGCKCGYLKKIGAGWYKLSKLGPVMLISFYLMRGFGFCLSIT